MTVSSQELAPLSYTAFNLSIPQIIEYLKILLLHHKQVTQHCGQ